MDISQDDTIQEFKRLGEGAWTVVYEFTDRDDERDVSIYCALSEPARRERALGDAGWDLTITAGGPGFSQSWPDGVETTTYHPRGGFDDGIEPLVLVREFYGGVESTLELDQQFRLFHNLRFDAASGNYFKMSSDGTEALAVKVEGRKVSIRTPLLKQYQAARQLDLLLFVDARAFSKEPVELPEQLELNDELMTGFRYYGALGWGKKFFTRFLATRVLPPGPIESCGIWPYEPEDDNYPEFIINEDEQGKPVSYSCNPDGLANYFGANPEAPHYLTPVHFRKEVLQKYYAKPELYSVEDGYLRCAGLWGIRIDNDHDDRVVVFLGDLGRDLPSGERDYWRSFQVAPDSSISETNFRRSFLAEFADPTSVDLRFRRLYTRVNELWASRYGWPLFREPKESDVHLLSQLRLALDDSQEEFEDALKLLAKLMSDSINEKEVQKALPTRIDDEKGIGKLERFLTDAGYPHTGRDIPYLRKVQELRSRVAAHLKGSDYEKVLTKNLGSLRGRAAVRALIEEGVLFLEDIVTWLNSVKDDKTDK